SRGSTGLVPTREPEVQDPAFDALGIARRFEPLDDGSGAGGEAPRLGDLNRGAVRMSEGGAHIQGAFAVRFCARGLLARNRIEPQGSASSSWGGGACTWRAPATPRYSNYYCDNFASMILGWQVQRPRCYAATCVVRSCSGVARRRIQPCEI